MLHDIHIHTILSECAKPDAHGKSGCEPFSLVSETMSISGITENDLVDVLSL